MRSLYSAIHINADELKGPGERWDMFTQGIGQPMSGQNTGVIMTPTYTNVPRSSHNGLPMGWGMRVDSWRAQTSLRFVVDPVLEWASDTHAELYYNARVHERMPLVDLLLAAQPCSDPTDWVAPGPYAANWSVEPQPLIFRENIGFRVDVSSTTNAMKYLRQWIVANVETARMTLWIHLQGPVNYGNY